MILCHESNCQKGRAAQIRYLVIHYTANDGDTAEGNCRYFANNPGRYSSAHYFVDENSVCQSVPEEDTAWHCGARLYKHPECRNANSIGIELCSRKDEAGRYYFKPETVKRAAALTRQLMDRYRIPKDRVVRHFDVTGKKCPAPFVDDEQAWEAFLAMLEKEEETEMDQKKFDEMMADWIRRQEEKEPADWSQEARDWAEGAGVIQGDGKGRKRYKAFVTREELTQVLYRTKRE